MPGRGQRKCHHCDQLYTPDHRNRFHQKYCSAPDCKKASKTASQQRWRRTPKGRRYFKTKRQVERVAQWRLKNPGYWKTHTRKPRKRSVALQDLLILQAITRQGVDPKSTGLLSPRALQYLLFAQHEALDGLILKLTGHDPMGTLQDHIASYRQTLILRARHVRLRGSCDAGLQTSSTAPVPSPSADAVQLDRSAPGA